MKNHKGQANPDRSPEPSPTGAHRGHRKKSLERRRHPAFQLELRQQRILHAGDGPHLSAARLQPLSFSQRRIEANMPKRGGKTRALSKEDFSRKSAIFLRPAAQFDSLVGRRTSTTVQAIIDAKDSSEAYYVITAGRAAQGRISGARYRRAGILWSV